MPGLRWTAIKLMIFTVVTIIVTIWLASVIGNLRLFSSPYQIEAEFTDASGLLQGDVVKAAGVTVGRVSAIGVDNGIAHVTMSIDEGVELPADLTAAIRFRNLIGQRMVSLTGPDDGTDDLTQPGDLITLDNTEPAFDLTALFNGLRPLIRSTNPADVNVVTRALTQALSGREDDVEAVFGNLDAISQMLAAKDRQLDELLDGLNVVAEDLGGRDQQLRSTLADLHTFLAELSAARNDLSDALITLDEASRRLGRVVRVNDERIAGELDDLATIADAVNDRRAKLRAIIRRLPAALVAIERATSYGQWANIHLIDVCKDDSGTCGTRAR